MARFKDQAICIRLLDWSETSQIVALLTLDHGKVRGLAKGSKRTSPSAVARFSGGIELLTQGEIVGVLKPGVELATLTEWDLQQPFRHLHTDLAALRLACYAADLAHAMLAEGDPHPRAFTELDRLLRALAERDPAERSAALLRFQWRLLDDCGYRPELHRDTRPRSGARSASNSTGAAAMGNGEAALPDAATYLFDPRAGGITADPAANPSAESSSAAWVFYERDAEGSGPWRVRRETVDLLRAVAAEDPDHEPSPADGPAADRANRLLCVYARTILDRHLPTMNAVLEEG